MPDSKASKLKEWKRNNLDKVRESKRRYYQEHREQILEQQRQHHLEHPEKKRKRVQQWRKANPEKYQQQWTRTNNGRVEYRAEYFQRKNEDPEFRKQRQERLRQWRKNNRERARYLNRLAEQRRNARKAKASGSYTEADIEELFLRQKGKCAFCKKKLTRFHIDHVMPLSKGGSNFPENLQLLCHSCNESKKDRHPDEVAKKLGRLFI